MDLQIRTDVFLDEMNKIHIIDPLVIEQTQQIAKAATQFLQCVDRLRVVTTTLKNMMDNCREMIMELQMRTTAMKRKQVELNTNMQISSADDVRYEKLQEKKRQYELLMVEMSSYNEVHTKIMEQMGQRLM